MQRAGRNKMLEVKRQRAIFAPEFHFFSAVAIHIQHIFNDSRILMQYSDINRHFGITLALSLALQPLTFNGLARGARLSR